MIHFLKNSRHHLSDVLEAPGQQRGRLVIVSFAPFHPSAKPLSGFGWGVMKFILLDHRVHP